MDPPPASKRRRDRRRRMRQRKRAAAATATGVGATVLAVEPQRQSAAATAPAATPATRGRNRRRSRRRRDRSARAAADEAPAASPVVGDCRDTANCLANAISTQEGSAPQASCNLEAMAAHLSGNVLQTTTEKIMSSDKTRKRNFQVGNKALKDSMVDAAACSPLARREHSIRENEASSSKTFKRSSVRFPIDSCTAQGTDMDYHKMKSADLPGNLEEVYQKIICPGHRSLQKSEVYRENENVSSLNSGSLQEGKKRRKKRAGKRHNRRKKATQQDSPAPTAADNSCLMTFLPENCISVLKPEEQRKKQDQNKASMTVKNSKRPEPFGVNLEGAIEKSCELGTNSLDSTFENRYELAKSNLDCTNMVINGLQEQDLACSSNSRNVNYLSPSHLAVEGAVEKSCELGTNSLDSTFENWYELAKSNLDCTNMVRNGLQEQDLACSSNSRNVNYLSPYLAVEYMEKIKLVFSPGKSLGFPKKKLLILDLNGLLADINEDYHNAHMADAKVRRKLVFRRPYCDDFLNFCALNFELGIWSSRKKENVASVVNIVMSEFKSRLLFCWDLSKCTFTGHKTLENKHKPLVLKELRKLWNMEEPDLPWEEGDFSPSNTLLVDDSPYKALRNPPYTAIFPRSYSYLNWNDNSLGPSGDLRVYLQNLAAADDVERFVRNNPFGQPFITESDPHWNFYAQIADRRAPLACCA